MNGVIQNNNEKQGKDSFSLEIGDVCQELVTGVGDVVASAPITS